MNTLDREKGRDVATNLYSLYDFMIRNLIKANVDKDLEKIKDVEDMMLELLDSWKQIVNQESNKKVNIKK